MKGMICRALITATALWVCHDQAFAQASSGKSGDFSDYARKLRETTLEKMEPKVAVPTTARTTTSADRFRWKTGIVTTVFWVGHTPGGREGNDDSAWDPQWRENYGGFDDPDRTKRRDFLPTAFVPKLNPFYIALPYNDVSGSSTKPEAKTTIPWFREAFVEEGRSVCRDRWVAVRNKDGKMCYAQWSDCGPHGTDQWQYVFGNEKPKPNASQGAGLSVSPAVRDYLSLATSDVTDWKFMNVSDVPVGPWALHGKNNPLVQNERHSATEERSFPKEEPSKAPAGSTPN